MITLRPRPKLFSSHHNLVLEPDEQTSLDMLFALDPLLDDERELLHQVLRAGIAAMNQRAGKRDAHLPTRAAVTQLPNVREKRSLHFPKRIELDLTSEQRDAFDHLADRVPHTSDTELVSEVISAGLAALYRSVDDAHIANAVASSERAAPKRRSVENYLGVPILEGLRQRLEDFLTDCPDVISDERAFAMLLDLGLRHVEDRSPAEVLKKVRAATRRRQRILVSAPGSLIARW